MTLDEAIKREEKIEKQQIARANALDDIPLFGMNQDDKKQIEECYKCAEEHRQLAEWLRDYKQLLEQQPQTGHWIADEVQLPDRVVLNYHCSVCGRKLVGYSTETLKDAPYCHCGAKMQVESDSQKGVDR